MVGWTRQGVCAQVFDFAGDEEVMLNDIGHRRGSLAGLGTVCRNQPTHQSTVGWRTYGTESRQPSAATYFNPCAGPY